MGSAPDTARLFLALWPSEGVREALLAWRDGWRWPRGATPVQAERLHLTLHFIGSVPRARLPELADGLQVPFRPFDLKLGHPALWKYGIAVLEPDVVPEPLLELQAALGAALHRLGLPPEQRPYRPHVTLARRADGAIPPADGPPIRWRARSYALMQSKLGPEGQYTTLEKFTKTGVSADIRTFK